MHDHPVMLLVEPATLLRRTVALTARTMGVATVHEAASHALALRLLKDQRFDGALIAIEPGQGDSAASALALVDQVRAGDTASHKALPIAIMIDNCDAAMLSALLARGVTRVLIKPFRARNLLDTFAAFAGGGAAVAAPAGLYRVEPD